jgi:hypothetical protein
MSPRAGYLSAFSRFTTGEVGAEGIARVWWTRCLCNFTIHFFVLAVESVRNRCFSASVHTRGVRSVMGKVPPLEDWQDGKPPIDRSTLIERVVSVSWSVMPKCAAVRQSGVSSTEISNSQMLEGHRCGRRRESQRGNYTSNSEVGQPIFKLAQTLLKCTPVLYIHSPRHKPRATRVSLERNY